MTVHDVQKELQKIANPEKAQHHTRFFKTGAGQYGEGDQFLGITTPTQRKIAKKYKEIELNEVTKLLQSNFHEYRFVGLVIVTLKFNKASNLEKKQLYHFYLENISAVNNWDLVDTSAPQVIGEYLLDHPADRDILYKFAHSDDLWLKRIAMLSTFTFIRDEEYEDALKIAKILVYDDHDLIHKAVGWMLREIGNRDLRTEEQFLQKYASTMPRTMLRYAIEKFPENKRQKYLKAT